MRILLTFDNLVSPCPWKSGKEIHFFPNFSNGKNTWKILLGRSIPGTSQLNIVVGEPQTGPIAGFQKYEYEKAMDGGKMGKRRENLFRILF